MDTNEGIRARIRASWGGLMVGDALGSPAEFCYREDILHRFPDGLDRMTDGFVICTTRKAGVVTDDTDMAVCLQRSLEEAQGWDPQTALRFYKEWYDTDPPDIGETIRNALRGEMNPDTEANGALMRVAPIAYRAALCPEFDWERAVREDTCLTHPNRVCIDASLAYVYALIRLLQAADDVQAVYRSTVEWARQHRLAEPVQAWLQEAEHAKPELDGEKLGWVRLAFQCAFWQLLHAPDFKTALVDIVSSGGDTDTNAAICGALLGALYGAKAIPRKWLVIVRANNPRYTVYLPRRSEMAKA